jgi:hypothetical protein
VIGRIASVIFGLVSIFIGLVAFTSALLIAKNQVSFWLFLLISILGTLYGAKTIIVTLKSPDQ